MNYNILHVRISNPDKILWEGEADWVSSVNSVGPFDILPLHSNFITVVRDQPVRIKTKTGIQEYSFDLCILYTNQNTVKIYTNL